MLSLSHLLAEDGSEAMLQLEAMVDKSGLRQRALGARSHLAGKGSSHRRQLAKQGHRQDVDARRAQAQSLRSTLGRILTYQTEICVNRCQNLKR